jgi:hypothetical protein
MILGPIALIISGVVTGLPSLVTGSWMTFVVR